MRLGSAPTREPGATIPVALSSKSALSLWEGCSLDYILSTCRGRCCRVQGTDRLFHTTVPLQLDQLALSAGGAGPHLITGTPRTAREVAAGVFPCPQQSACGTCQGHGRTINSAHAPPVPAKPRSCTLSPWRLTANSNPGRSPAHGCQHTLSIRNRYRLLSCYRHENAVPAYQAFADGLALLFGQRQTAFAAEWFANPAHADSTLVLYAHPSDVSFFVGVSTSRARQAQPRRAHTPD